MDEQTAARLAFRALLWRMRVISADADELEDLATGLDERAEATDDAKADAEVGENAAGEEHPETEGEDAREGDGTLDREDRVRLLEKIVEGFMRSGDWNGPDGETARQATERIESKGR